MKKIWVCCEVSVEWKFYCLELWMNVNSTVSISVDLHEMQLKLHCSIYGENSHNNLSLFVLPSHNLSSSFLTSFSPFIDSFLCCFVVCFFVTDSQIAQCWTCSKALFLHCCTEWEFESHRRSHKIWDEIYKQYQNQSKSWCEERYSHSFSIIYLSCSWILNVVLIDFSSFCVLLFVSSYNVYFVLNVGLFVWCFVVCPYRQRNSWSFETTLWSGRTSRELHCNLSFNTCFHCVEFITYTNSHNSLRWYSGQLMPMQTGLQQLHFNTFRKSSYLTIIDIRFIWSNNPFQLNSYYQIRVLWKQTRDFYVENATLFWWYSNDIEFFAEICFETVPEFLNFCFVERMTRTFRNGKKWKMSTPNTTFLSLLMNQSTMLKTFTVLRYTIQTFKIVL